MRWSGLLVHNLGGILSIGDMAGKSVQGGLTSALFFMAILSINLACINLLPIPVVDGGHILLNGIEWIRGKPLSAKLQERIFTVGFIFILFVMTLQTSPLTDQPGVRYSKVQQPDPDPLQ